MQAALTAVDNTGGSGLAKTEYSYDGTNWTTYTTPVTVSSEGTTKLFYRSSDNAANVETAKEQVIQIDKTVPEAVIKFDPVSKEIKVYNSEGGQEAGYVMLPARKGKVDKAGAWGTRQYTLTDGANNSTVIVLNYKKANYIH